MRCMTCLVQEPESRYRNFGSINLEVHVTHMDGRAVVDWEKLERTVRASVHFLDNVIDMNHYPITQIEEVTKANRKIGLGVMGFSRMLFKLGIAYDSSEGIDCARNVMQFIRDIGHSESERMADRRGVFPNWKGSVYEKQGKRLRNAYITTVAPTGTLSMIADTSGGCEPEFSLIWYKNVMGGEHLPYVQEMFMEIARAEGFWSEELVNKIIANHGSVRGINEVPSKWKAIFATAHDVASEWHVKMQAAFQESTDSAVSKTINMPLGASLDDVKDAYILAYKLGCKGITVYRDGSRSEQVMNVGKSQDKGKAGGCEGSQNEAIGRLISLAFRSGVSPQSIIRQLIGIRCNQPYGLGKNIIHSCADAISKAVLEYMISKQGDAGREMSVEYDRRIGSACPDCGCEMEFSEGCEKCHFCGHSKCY